MQTTERVYPALDVNLKDVELFQRGVPHALFARMRREAPVCWVQEPEPQEPGFWAVTRYDDVVHVSKNPRLFSSARGGHQISYPEGIAFGAANRAVVANMIGMDPPEHNAYRKLVAPAFIPRAVRAMEDRIQEITTRTIDAIAPKGECEFVSEVAAELPVSVLADLLGVPHEERRMLFEWSNRLLETPAANDSEGIARVLGTFQEVFAYGKEMIERRRREPRDDLMGWMAHGEVDGERIDQDMLDGFFLLLVIAGNETTRNTIAGGMLALIEHPDQRQQLIDDPGLIPTGVEEILRWVTPVIHFRRTATEATELAGQPIREGDKVVMWYPAANRDEAVFDRPDEFDVRREPNEHLAFGIGQHYCIGAPLARAQLRVMFTELLRRLPDMELAGDVKRKASFFISGIDAMPVRFTPRPR